jgi:hypothetical protein
MTITIATPDEHIKLVATYMRPSPQSNPEARAEWTELADYAVHLGIKNNTNGLSPLGFSVTPPDPGGTHFKLSSAPFPPFARGSPPTLQTTI